ncbi:hypothetical protein NE237_004820 [Protea cynaroides]|uniref:Uncharacterized protein n=1 Tax=Protea cynaroides TaxID=273540 RepID=A0A9Q0KK78_9MAGN|nr:hypothetical protein NE237_004820 [Protea cynaroides]
MWQHDGGSNDVISQYRTNSVSSTPTLFCGNSVHCYCPLGAKASIGKGGPGLALRFLLSIRSWCSRIGIYILDSCMAGLWCYFYTLQNFFSWLKSDGAQANGYLRQTDRRRRFSLSKGFCNREMQGWNSCREFSLVDSDGVGQKL